MIIEEQVRGPSYIKEVGFSVQEPSEMQRIFIETSKRLLKDSNLKAH